MPSVFGPIWPQLTFITASIDQFHGQYGPSVFEDLFCTPEGSSNESKRLRERLDWEWRHRHRRLLMAS